MSHRRKRRGRPATEYLCETKKKQNTFAVSLLRASLERVLKEETSVTFIHFDQVYYNNRGRRTEASVHTP